MNDFLAFVSLVFYKISHFSSFLSYWPGLSNIIGIIVYISSNAGDPSDKRDDDKKYTYSYGWSFYFGALSFIVAETVAVLVINIYIEKNKEVRWKARREFIRSLSSSSPYSRIPSFRYRRRTSHASSHSTEASRENSPVLGPKGMPSSSGPLDELSMYALARDSVTENTYSPEHDSSAEFLQVHNCFPNDLKDGVNRRTTPVWEARLCLKIPWMRTGTERIQDWCPDLLKAEHLWLPAMFKSVHFEMTNMSKKDSQLDRDWAN